eukprot:14211381-Ditylum_brightwellii.AAC.1
MLSSIIDWDEDDMNMSDMCLQFLNQPDFVKFVAFNYGIGAGSDTVSAATRCMISSYKIYWLHKDCESKYIVGYPLGARSCPYYRQIDKGY